MRDFAKALSITLLALGNSAHAWYLDQSCVKPKRSYSSCDNPEYLPDMSALVTATVTSAFELAGIGRDTLNTLKNGKGSQAQIDLLDFMFGFAVKDNKAEHTGYLDTVTSVFEQVLDFKKNKDGSPSAQTGSYPVGEVVVFCDYTRYRENVDCSGYDSPGNACDTVLQMEVAMSDLYHNCKNPSFTDDDAYVRPLPCPF
ncbi:uncharacterized protein N7459_001084 [Penicillium hispanicum]|uniref:uncharacterized protein n=1 Tax=Penicillium hispanicum TaxID=1080232 RepID=UPI002541BCD5|nr:uncharacterized protein N7459_001084 [Penicillium hispanicum]KAJ5594876.1 hypothetical protein N7459_001084 [Penicillium hispanicum]